MADEFKHRDAGKQLTRIEDNAVDRHIADSQLANDMLYYNGAYWIRATPASILTKLSGQAGAAFDWNAQNLTNVGTVDGIDVSAHPAAVLSVHGIDAAGIYSLATQSSTRAYLSANQSIPGDGDYWTVALNTEVYDTQNEIDSSRITGTADATEANKLHDADGGFSSGDVGKVVWNTTDNAYTTVSGFVDSGELDITDDIMVNGEGYILYFSKFTATEDGTYLFLAHGLVLSLGNGKYFETIVYKNGATLIGREMIYNTTGGVLNTHTEATAIVQLSASDYVQMKCRTNHGSNLNLQGGATYNYFAAIKIA